MTIGPFAAAKPLIKSFMFAIIVCCGYCTSLIAQDASCCSSPTPAGDLTANKDKISNNSNLEANENCMKEAKVTNSCSSVDAPISAPTVDFVNILTSQRSEVMNHLRHLTETIGPRLTGTAKLDEATKWAMAQFQNFGVDRVFLEKCADFPVRFERGISSGRIVAPVAEDLTFRTNAWTAGTDGEVEGRVVSLSLNNQGKVDLNENITDAWLLAPITDQSGKVKLPDNELEDFVLKHGAAGVIYPSRGELIHSMGKYPRKESDRSKIPQVLLLQEQWNSMKKLVNDREEVKVRFNIGNKFLDGSAPLYNVIADIRGSEFPDEFVVIGAHLDSWDGATGAQDNGAGCAAVMEAARLIVKSGYTPKRTIRFILFAGEEQGLIGSAGYVKNHGLEVGNTSAALIMDAGASYISGIQVPENMVEDFESVFGVVEKLDSKRPFRIFQLGSIDVPSQLCCSPDSEAQVTAKQIKTTGAKFNPASRTDAGPFLMAGTPAFLMTQADMRGYNRVHHSQYDLINSVDASDLKHSVNVLAIGAMGIANLKSLLPRNIAIAASESSAQNSGCCSTAPAAVPAKTVEACCSTTGS